MPHRTFDDGDSLEARQFLLDNRCIRKHPKRHRTNKRRSRFAMARAARAKVNAGKFLAMKRRRRAMMRAYFQGEINECPA